MSHLLWNPLANHNSCCNNFNSATLLLSSTDDTPYDCLALTDLLLTPHDDLQETPLDNTDFSWFTNGSYLRDENDKYAGNALETPFEISEVVPLPLATLAQWAELYAFLRPAFLTKDKTANIYVNSR